jgi:putative membrane protein
LINCCAADALPLAIALDSDPADAFSNDQWVQVDGIFRSSPNQWQTGSNGFKAQIKPVEAPAVPYLF